jgi:hypothetical protein
VPDVWEHFILVVSKKIAHNSISITPIHYGGFLLMNFHEKSLASSYDNRKLG